MPVWRGSLVVGKTNIHAKFSLNSSNNLNYKETSPEFIAGENNNNNNKMSIAISMSGPFKQVCPLGTILLRFLSILVCSFDTDVDYLIMIN
jgi:hypothetical protein